MPKGDKQIHLKQLDIDAVMKFICDHAAAHHGNSPTFRIIGKQFGITSTSQMSRLVKLLVKSGRVTRDPALGTQAPIEVVGSQWMEPTDVTRIDALFNKLWSETPAPATLYFSGIPDDVKSIIDKFRLRSTESAAIGSMGRKVN